MAQIIGLIYKWFEALCNFYSYGQIELEDKIREYCTNSHVI